MEKNKKTQKELFAEAIVLAEGAGKAELVEFFKSRIEQLDKKATNKKPTKEQEANVALKAEIASVLTEEGATVSDIMTKSETLKTLSNQKVSALLRQMVEAGTAVKVPDGKKSLFKLA